ncbi:MFS transporter [Xanthovirga aplysinae]|uniref:MFS transporter n=1 Tax=Xanthovirga aplysinae TaxID=2529853 RepID=UPI0012BCBBEA|nr:MFS transporter [Xanthovirga aplysinae]MTI32445.1 NarK/NasA family nitrate transporter [Xanthovirga aplysinae]
MKDAGTANKILFLNTFAFTICFAVWLMNGVLVTFLVDNQVFDWDSSKIGWLMGIPVLTGAIFRLPAGILTDKFGGKPVFTILLLLCAIPTFLLSYVNSFWGFVWCSFGFGLTGASFAVGIAYTSIFFDKKNQGTALGIFGVGNAGAALTTIFAPSLLNYATNNGAQIENWRVLPIIYAGILVLTAILFFLLAKNKKPESSNRTLKQQLQPLKNIRVWRFGLYYFLVFGCFVAFAQWLVPYFLNVYAMPLVFAGICASLFSLPSGVIRALGGYLSDLFGARKVMYWVLGSSAVISLFLIIPRMDISSPGKGVLAKNEGIVTNISPSFIQVDNQVYPLQERQDKMANVEKENHFLPVKESWQTPVVQVNDRVTKKQLIAKGSTHIYFQANVWVFTVLVILIGAIWGIGKAAVYKHIPDYFPKEVGVVGGMVGVLGGLGGFFCPVIFGYLLEATGLWSSAWMFMFFLSASCLIWMHAVVQRIIKHRLPKLSTRFEEGQNDQLDVEEYEMKIKLNVEQPQREEKA